jgi:hypothetical protein
MSKREDSSLILQNLKKRELRSSGETIVPLEEAERHLARGGYAPALVPDGRSDASTPDSMIASRRAGSGDSTQDDRSPKTRLKPRERVARSALIVRLDPALHRRLEATARYNRLTMNDIAIEAIELHLQNFPQPSESDGQASEIGRQGR